MIETLNDIYSMLKKILLVKIFLIYLVFTDYSIEHFTYEEELMEQNNYPDLYIHKYEHEKFMDSISHINSKFDANESNKNC